MRGFNRKTSLAEITALTERLAEIEGELRAASKELRLSEDMTTLINDKAVLEIELVKIKEQHARESRDEGQHHRLLHERQRLP